MFCKPPKYLIHCFYFQTRHKVGKFYTAEEALTLLRNMGDFEDESTSESEIEGDSSDSSEYTPEQQYQVRTDSNIQTLLLKETCTIG